MEENIELKNEVIENKIEITDDKTEKSNPEEENMIEKENVIEEKQKRITTIKVSFETKEKINSFRLYKRESFDEILNRVIH